MSYYDPEQHVQALVTYLRASLNGYIDLVNGTVTDGLVVSHVPAANVVLGGKWPIPTLSPTAPAIEVAIPTEILQNFSVGNTDADETLTVIMRAWQQHVGNADTAIEDLYRKSLRLGRAIKLAVLPASFDAFGNASVCTMLRGSYRVDPQTDQREAWTSSLVYELTVVDDAVFV